MFGFAGTAEPVGFVDGGLEAEHIPGLKILLEGLHIVKRRYSGFEGTELEAILRSLNVSCVAICGYMPTFCRETRARAAHDKDYFVDFIADATGVPDLGGEFTQEKIIEAVSATLNT